MSVAPRQRANNLLAFFFAVCALISGVGAIFYLTQDTSFLASEGGHHPIYATVAGIVFVGCIVAAELLRPKKPKA